MFAAIAIEVARFVRALILDDDIRVPFGKAHEHAKHIVTEGKALKRLLDALQVEYTSPCRVALSANLEIFCRSTISLSRLPRSCACQLDAWLCAMNSAKILSR